MATIQLNNSDLRSIIREAVSRIVESEEWFDHETLCRLPYYVSLRFSGHAIKRGYERRISANDIVKDMQSVSDDIISAFEAGRITVDEKFKVCNRKTCALTVATIAGTSASGKRIHRVRIISAYIWDGRNNLDEKVIFFTPDEESQDFRDALEWNRENQDIVKDYVDWKHDRYVPGQRREMEKWYEKRGTINRHTKNNDYKRMEKERREREMADTYKKMPWEDYAAIGDYDMKMDYMPMSSKGSMNRDLRAMDLLNMRKEAEEQRRYYGDKVKDVPDEELVKYPKAVGKIDLPDQAFKRPKSWANGR